MHNETTVCSRRHFLLAGMAGMAAVALIGRPLAAAAEEGAAEAGKPATFRLVNLKACPGCAKPAAVLTGRDQKKWAALFPPDVEVTIVIGRQGKIAKEDQSPRSLGIGKCTKPHAKDLGMQISAPRCPVDFNKVYEEVKAASEEYRELSRIVQEGKKLPGDKKARYKALHPLFGPAEEK